MLAPFQPAHDRLEKQLASLLASVRSLSERQQSYRPAGGGWCILEVLQHILLAEEAFTGYAAKKGAGKPESVSFVSQILYFGVSQILKTSFRVKAPTDAVVPKEILPLSNLEPRFKKTRGQLRKILDSIPEERAGAILFKHPIAGKLDPLRGLGFLETHIEHHKVQIERITSDPGFPK